MSIEFHIFVKNNEASAHANMKHSLCEYDALTLSARSEAHRQFEHNNEK